MFVLNYLFAKRRNLCINKRCVTYSTCEPVTASVTGEFRSETPVPAVYFLDRQGKLQLNTISGGQNKHDHSA